MRRIMKNPSTIVYTLLHFDALIRTFGITTNILYSKQSFEVQSIPAIQGG